MWILDDTMALEKTWIQFHAAVGVALAVNASIGSMGKTARKERGKLNCEVPNLYHS